MSVIIDIEMPKRCLDCQLMGREKMYCQLHPRKDLNVIRVVSEKPDWCPLKEVPTGKWINRGIQWECSECHYRVTAWNNTKYCPNCSANMENEKQTKYSYEGRGVKIYQEEIDSEY